MRFACQARAIIPIVPHICVRNCATGNWFFWAERKTLEDARRARSGLGIGHETRIIASIDLDRPMGTQESHT